MPGMFSAIDSLSTALQAFQTELDVTGNNISNVNTPGYSRQVANIAAGPSYQYTQGATVTMGTGVQLSSVTRIQNMFLQQSQLSASADSGRLGSMSSTLTAVQSALNEPGTGGISDSLSKFFNAWSGLSSSPSDPSQQLQVQTTAQTLVGRVQSTYQQIQQQSAQTTTAIGQTIQTIQSQVDTVASLNKEIQAATAQGATPNSLLDQRDQALNTLSGLVNITTQTNSDDTVTVSMGGMRLVDQTGGRTVPTTWNAASQSLTDASGNSWPVTGGQLAGQFGVLNSTSGYMTQLDTLANTITSAVNTVYASGTNAAGTTGAQFFNQTTPAGGASGFSLAAGVAASPTNIATGTSGKASDGGIALAISQMQSQPQASLGNQSITDYYNSFVTGIGQQTSYYNNAVTTQSAVSTQIQNQIQSVSGVSLDEEMANMLNFQRSYQAAASTLSSINSTMDSLMSMVI